MTSTTGSMNEQYKKKEHIDRTRELFWSQTYHPLKYAHGLPWKGTGQCVSTWQRRHSALRIADYPALSVNRAGGGNPLYAEDTPNQEFLIWCAPIQEFLIRCTPIQEFEFTDSVLVFVRGVIWHQEGYYCYIISQMNTFIINKILPRKCLPLLTACRHL